MHVSGKIASGVAVRGDGGVTGEGRIVGVPKFHSWGKCTMPLTNINSDWMSNASSGLCIILVILYYAPVSMLRPTTSCMGYSGARWGLSINCPNIRDIPYNQIPLWKVGDYWGFDTRSVTVQYTESIALFKMSSVVIKCPTIGAASFGQSPYIARHLVVGIILLIGALRRSFNSHFGV